MVQNLSDRLAKMDNDNILMRSELENELELLKREKNTVDKQLELLKDERTLVADRLQSLDTKMEGSFEKYLNSKVVGWNPGVIFSFGNF